MGKIVVVRFFFCWVYIQNNQVLKKLNFDLTPRVEGVCKNGIYACIMLYAPFTLI